jgi:hypothetical protein
MSDVRPVMELIMVTVRHVKMPIPMIRPIILVVPPMSTLKRIRMNVWFVMRIV